MKYCHMKIQYKGEKIDQIGGNVLYFHLLWDSIWCYSVWLEYWSFGILEFSYPLWLITGNWKAFWANSSQLNLTIFDSKSSQNSIVIMPYSFLNWAVVAHTSHLHINYSISNTIFTILLQKFYSWAINTRYVCYK